MDNILEALMGSRISAPRATRRYILGQKRSVGSSPCYWVPRERGDPEIDLVRQTMTPKLSINMVSEDWHGAFGKSVSMGPCVLAWGFILGGAVTRWDLFPMRLLCSSQGLPAQSLSLPQKLRTKNVVERLNEEIRRLERIIRMSPNREIGHTVDGAFLVERDEGWMTGRKHMDKSDYLTWRKASKVKTGK